MQKGHGFKSKLDPWDLQISGGTTLKTDLILLWTSLHELWKTSTNHTGGIPWPSKPSEKAYKFSTQKCYISIFIITLPVHSFFLIIHVICCKQLCSWSKNILLHENAVIQSNYFKYASPGKKHVYKFFVMARLLISVRDSYNYKLFQVFSHL